MSSSRTRSMSPGRPLRTQKQYPSSQQLQQQHLAQLQQLQQLNQRFGSSQSSFSSSSSHTPTQVSSANSTHSSSRHSVYGTYNYASSDVSFSNNRSVSQPTLSEPATPTLVPDRYRRKSMVNLPSHERSPSLPSTTGSGSSQGSHVTGAQTYTQQAHSTNPASSNHSPPPRLSYSSTDSSAPSTTAASTSTIGTVHSFHKKTQSEDTTPKQLPMVLPSDARRKSLLKEKDPLGSLADPRASAISLSSYHTVQSNSSPTRSMISDDSRESSPDVRQDRELGKDVVSPVAAVSATSATPATPAPALAATATPGLAPPTSALAPPTPSTTTAPAPTSTAPSNTTSYEDAVAAGVAAPADVDDNEVLSPTEPNNSNYDVAAAQYDAPPSLDPAEQAERGRYRAKHAPPSPTKPQYPTQQQHVSQQIASGSAGSLSQPSHQQSQRTMSLGGQSAFKDFDQPLYTTKSNMSVGGKSIGGMSTSGMSTSGMSTQSSFSGLRHQKSSGSLRDKFKKVFSFGRSKSSLSNAPTGSQQINLNPGQASRSERTSTMTSTTSGRSFSEFLRRSSKPDNFDDARSIESNKSSSSFAALKRAGKNLLKKNPPPEQARSRGPSSSYDAASRAPSAVPSRAATPAQSPAPSRAATPNPKLAPPGSSGSGFTPGLSPPKNTATASLSVSPAEVDRETAQWSAGSSLEGVLGSAPAVSSGHGVSGNAVVASTESFADAQTGFDEPAPAPVPAETAAAPLSPHITTTLASTLASDSSSPTSVSSVNGGSAGSETDADEFVAAETVFPKHLGVEDIDNIRTSLDRTKSLERRGSRRRKVTPDSQSHHAPDEAVPNPTEVHVHHPKSSLGRSESTSRPRSILKSKQSDGSMVSVDTVTGLGEASERASADVSRVSDVSRDTIDPAHFDNTPSAIDIEIANSGVASADPEATPTGLESFMESAKPSGPTSEAGTDVESMFANFSSISSDLDLSFSTQLEPLGLPVRPESPTPSQQSSVRSTDSASVSRFATKLKDNLFKRKDSSSGGFNPDLHETISEDDHLGRDSGDHVPLEGSTSFETASITSTEAPSLSESFRSDGSYSAPVPPQIPGGQRGNAPLRHFSPGPTPSNPNTHNRRFSGGIKTPQTAASRRYHQHGRSASYNDDGSRASASPTTANYPVVHAPSPVGHVRKGNVSFSSRIVIYDTWDSDDYDRRTEPATCNRLTPLLAQQIKEELNNFKMNMDVHHESRIYTHFF
ncbi:Protein BNI4 [Yarrowia sp. B02]|nr:Protein BNI4 [Yarrowia sp. B02]